MSEQLQEPLRTLLRNRTFDHLWGPLWSLLLDRLRRQFGSSLRGLLSAQLEEDWDDE